jgi:hypothetical protein
VEHYAGLDVSLELTSVCVVDERGAIVRETVLFLARPPSDASPDLLRTSTCQ